MFEITKEQLEREMEEFRKMHHIEKDAPVFIGGGSISIYCEHKRPVYACVDCLRRDVDRLHNEKCDLEEKFKRVPKQWRATLRAREKEVKRLKARQNALNTLLKKYLDLKSSDGRMERVELRKELRKFL